MNIASYIDHTVLKINTSKEDIERICQEAQQYQFAAVCVPPFFVKKAAQLLQNSKTKVATVIGFPLGYSSTPAKIEEIKRAIDDGADEIDAVINICALKSQNWNYLRNDIDSMTTATHLKGKQIKLILETGLLSEKEIEQLCEMALDIKPNYLKTSTGFNGVGAELEKVRLIKRLVGSSIAIKASGGIRNLHDALAFVEAGAKRIGTSSGVIIAQEQQ